MAMVMEMVVAMEMVVVMEMVTAMVMVNFIDHLQSSFIDGAVRLSKVMILIADD